MSLLGSDGYPALEKTKPSNPKYSVGVRKAPLHNVPCGPLYEVGLAFMEGARKYGSHNYRDVGVRSSVYYDAVMRHVMAYWEGESVDAASGVHHLTKAVACLFVWRDSMLMGNYTDDRPMRYPSGLHVNALNEQAETVIEKYPDCVEPFTEVRRVDHETGEQ